MQKRMAATASSAMPTTAACIAVAGIFSPREVAQGLHTRMSATAIHISPMGRAQRSATSGAMASPPGGTWLETWRRSPRAQVSPQRPATEHEEDGWKDE